MKAKSLPLNDNVKIRPSGGFFTFYLEKSKKQSTITIQVYIVFSFPVQGNS